MSSPFRKTSKASGTVARRKKEYLDAHGPDGNNYHKAKTRRNAYVTFSQGSKDKKKGKNTYIELPSNPDSYDALYSNAEGRPDVILNSVTITEGSDLGMIRTVEAEYECLSREAFDRLEPRFLRPGNPDRTISVKYGYSDGDGPDGSVTDAIICKYAYELTEKNTYKCTFKAYGPGPFISKLNFTKGNYGKRKIVTGGFFKSPVTTLPQFLKWCAQDGGIMANIDISNWSKPSVGEANKSVIVIDNPNARTPTTMIGRAVYKVLQSVGFFGADSSKVIYCTLGWFVDTLQKYHIAPNLKKAMKGRSINCSNKWIKNGGHPISNVGSAFPMSIVLPGAGNYGSAAVITDKETKLNFDANNCGKVIPGTSGKGSADYSKILLSFDFLANNVFGSAAKSGQVSSGDKSDKNSQKNDPPNVTIGTIMKKVFDDIYHATGGLVHLALQEDSGNSKVINVIPRNCKAGGYKATPFDPIRGDGITRKCTVKCDVPANDAYAVANGNAGGGGGAGAVTSLIAGDKADETNPLEDAQAKVEELMSTGLSANEFANEDCEALQAAFKDLIMNQPPSKQKSLTHDNNVWPLNLEIELDGTEGFKFGDVVSSTFMPAVYTGTKVEFVVTEATHVISNNDWVTKLKTQCFLGQGA